MTPLWGQNHPLEMPFKSHYQAAHRRAPAFIFPEWGNLLHLIFPHIHAAMLTCRHRRTNTHVPVSSSLWLSVARVSISVKSSFSCVVPHLKAQNKFLSFPFTLQFPFVLYVGYVLAMPVDIWGDYYGRRGRAGTVGVESDESACEVNTCRSLKRYLHLVPSFV